MHLKRFETFEEIYSYWEYHYPGQDFSFVSSNVHGWVSVDWVPESQREAFGLPPSLHGSGREVHYDDR